MHLLKYYVGFGKNVANFAHNVHDTTVVSFMFQVEFSFGDYDQRNLNSNFSLNKKVETFLPMTWRLADFLSDDWKVCTWQVYSPVKFHDVFIIKRDLYLKNGSDEAS